MRNRLLFGLAIIILVVSAIIAQQPSGSKPSDSQPSQMPMSMDKMPCPMMKGMMQGMQKLQASSKEMDGRLGPLVTEMNTATGSAKVDRMAAVITEMTTQRTQMHEQIAGMMNGMIQSGMESGMSCSSPPAKPSSASEKR